MNMRQMTTALVSTLALVMSGVTVAEDTPAPATPAPAATEAPAAVPAAAPSPAPAAEPAAAPVPSAAAEAPPPAAAPAAPSDTATVIFFRPSKLLGAAIGFIVREGQTELGKLRNGKYFVLHVSPGRHQFVVHSEAKDLLTIDADPGETYYIQGGVTMGFLAGRPNLAPSNQAAFEAVKASMKEVPAMSDKD
ncbi:MAG TPA: hypothetical protein VKC11_03230 [Steroidobacteraceae bacterium]|nr:hypothetical protein [Steroidobacteraceae bacterium]